tara:strand:- start:1817 stop:2404 length:588 start_codon:yes stop_codon:yes gene_type:complete
MPPDYSNTVIYRFYCIDPNIKDDYIGHSAEFHKRKIKHKHRCNNNKNSSKTEYHSKVCKFIRENGGFDNWIFEILEYANLKDVDEAETLEGHYIEIFKPTLNKNDVGLTPEEKDEYQRKQNKKRREDPEYRKKEAERCKKNRVANPENWAASLAASNAKRLESYTCICGCSTSKNNEKKHLDSKKHKKFVENNPE